MAITQIQAIIDQTTQQYGALTTDTLPKVVLSLSEEDKQQLVSSAMSYLLKVGIIFFITNLILMSGLLGTIYTLTTQQFSVTHIAQRALKLLPLIASFILLIIPGFFIFSILATFLMPIAVPLAILVVVLYLSLYVIFLAVLITPQIPDRFMTKLRVAFKFFKREKSCILPMIALWFLSIFLLKNIAILLNMDNFILVLIVNIAKSLFAFITICYLYRLFSLSHQASPYDASN